MGDFKKLRVWQEAVALAVSVYEETEKNLKLSKDFGLKDQIRRCSVSIASNIAEGDERKTNKEAIYFFNISKGSSAELITQLIIAQQINYLTTQRFEVLHDQAEKIRASLKKLIKARSLLN